MQCTRAPDQGFCLELVVNDERVLLYYDAASSSSSIPEGSEDVVAYNVGVLASGVTTGARATAVGMMRCRRDFSFLSSITVISLFDFGTKVISKKNKGGLDHIFLLLQLKPEYHS